MTQSNKLPVHSIFESISGEVGVHIKQGAWCTFIRLQGCNLQCNYCDTQVTQRQAGPHDNWMNIEDIVSQVKTKYVVITGGEPLIHVNLPILVEKLFDAKKRVQIETNGTMKIPDLPYVGWVIDYKSPSSGLLYLTALEFYQNIRMADSGVDFVVKFVIQHSGDYIHAQHIMEYLIEKRLQCTFAFSPVNALANKAQSITGFFKDLSPELRNRCILNIQIHKIAQLP